MGLEVITLREISQTQREAKTTLSHLFVETKKFTWPYRFRVSREFLGLPLK
jgi:hypothetical protein